MLGPSDRDGYASMVRGLGGTLVISRMEGEREVFVSATIVSAKLRNEP